MNMESKLVPMLSTSFPTIRLGKYQHYKGQFYQALHICAHTETGEAMVFYQSLYDGRYWVRPLDQFISDVEHDGKLKKRFVLIE